MRFEKEYPYNLIDDLMIDNEFYSSLEHDDLVQAVEVLIRGLDDIAVINSHGPSKMKDVIHLWYAENKTLKEIGETLGISINRVEQIKSRAKRILRNVRAREIKNISLLKYVEELSEHINTLGDYSIMSFGYDSDDNWFIELQKYGKKTEIRFPRRNKT